MYFKEIWRLFQGSFKETSSVFKESFKDISRKIEWYSNGVLSGFQGYLKEVSRVSEGSF